MIYGKDKGLSCRGIGADVVNICTIKPLDEELVVKTAMKTGKVVTAEEHNIIGGWTVKVCTNRSRHL